MTSTSSFTSSANTYQNCYNVDEGGIFNLVSVTFVDVGSTFRNNQAVKGGVFRIESSSLSFTSSDFISNYANEGGTVYMTLSSTFTGRGIRVINSLAYANGGMICSSDSLGTSTVKVTLDTQSRLSNIKSQTGNGGSFYLDAPEGELRILGSTTVTDSEATVGRGGLVYINRAKIIDF